MNLQPKRASAEGEWISWTIDGRAGAKLRLGPVFLGELSYPHDPGLGARWRAWLNHEHLGFFRDELEARAHIEAEIVKRLSLMRPAWSKFQRARSKTGAQREAATSKRPSSSRYATSSRDEVPAKLARRPKAWEHGTNGILSIADRG